MQKNNIFWLWDRLDAIGGVETFLLNLAKHLDKSRFNIYMGVFKTGYIESYFRDAGVKVIEIKRDSKFDFQTIPRLISAVRRLKIDVIHTHGHFPGISGRIAGKLTGKKIISTYHLALNEDEHPLSTKIITKTTLPLAHYINLTSKGVEKSFYGHSAVFQKNFINKKKHFTIYYGIDVDAIDKAVSGINKDDVRRSLSISEDDIFLLTAGRLTEQKGHCYLIDAIKKVLVKQPKVKLIIFGEGELRQKLEKLIIQSKLTDYIRILPPVKEIFKIMAASDIFVFPSLWESFGLALAEAMAIGKPAIATNVTGVNEIINHGENGILVKNRNADVLSDAISRVIENKELQKLLSENSRKTIVNHFTIRKSVENYTCLYEA